MKFENRVVLITGAGSGIGAATAKLLAKQGANVVLVGLGKENLKNVAKECQAFGRKALPIEADVSIDENVHNFVKKVIDEFGRLDVIVNSVGILRAGSVLQGDLLQAFDDVVKTNLRPVILLTKLAAPYLEKTKGNIINISTVSSMRVLGLNDFTAVSICKAALDHFTRFSATELAKKGIRVNVINPGIVKTGFFDETELIKGGADAMWDNFSNLTALRKICEPEEVANMISYLASDKAKSVTGSNFVIDNGWLLKG